MKRLRTYDVDDDLDHPQDLRRRGDDDRSRKRLGSHESSVDGFDRRKSFDRYSITSSSPRSSYNGGGSGGGGGERMHRSESFSGAGAGARREFVPKGFRSERDRSGRREGVGGSVTGESGSSWRRFGSSINGSGSKEMESVVEEDGSRGTFGNSMSVRSPRGVDSVPERGGYIERVHLIAADSLREGRNGRLVGEDRVNLISPNGSSREVYSVDSSMGRVGRLVSDDRANVRSPRGSRSKEVADSKSTSKKSPRESCNGREQVKINEVRRNQLSPRETREAVVKPKLKSLRESSSGGEQWKINEVKRNESPRRSRESLKSSNGLNRSKDLGGESFKSNDLKKKNELIRGSREGLKSPNQSKDNGGERSKNSKSNEAKKNELPREKRGAFRSPTISKESGSEHSKSNEVTKIRSPWGLVETVKSPTASKESGSECSKSIEVKKIMSPQELSETEKLQSPTASKDSSGQHSKSSEGKESASVVGENSSSSEMEEGELDPEQEPLGKPELQSKLPSDMNCEDDKNSQFEKEIATVKDVELSAEVGFNDKQTVNNVVRQVVEVVDSEGDEIDEDVSDKGCIAKECSRKENRAISPLPYRKREFQAQVEEIENTKNEEMPLMPMEQNQKVEEKRMLLEVEEAGASAVDSRAEILETNEIEERNLVSVMFNLAKCSKDKGKSLAVSPGSETNSAENDHWVEKDLLKDGHWVEKDLLKEGPSSRGLDLFSTTPSISQNHSGLDKNKDENLTMEPLELSLGLSLPNVLLPRGSHNQTIVPSSPSHGRSVQSMSNTFRTNSDGFTTSISFSGSQTMNHNPSCSLTYNSLDNCEQSVGSRPIFKGVWPLNSSEPNLNELSVYQKGLINGNGNVSVHGPPNSKGILSSFVVQGEQNHNASEELVGIPISLDRQSSFSRQVPGLHSLSHNESKLSTYSFGSHETGSSFNRDKIRSKKERSDSLMRSSSQKEMEQLLIGGTGNGFVERILAMLVSEPIQIMAGRIQEMTELSISRIQEGASEIIVNEAKRGQLHAFRQGLQNRSDITLDTLLICHRAQLEILVAFKTGRKDFLSKGLNIPSSDLAEVFLNLKCRNLTCLSSLPVDECECKVCSQKSGFCSACMCLICSKFDMASNTCSWVGCDVCLHWCHTDCGLRERYVRNGRSPPQGTTEMQFHCVACRHPSEMFGFVKEVFKTCAKEWKAETLSMELEYVRKIFFASDDSRGKRLRDVAGQLRARLENKSNLSEVYNHIMNFLTENDSERFPVKDSSSNKNPTEASMSIVRPVQEPIWLTSVSTENASHRGNASASPSFDWDQASKRSSVPDFRNTTDKKPVVDELESIVRIKQAEAKMFQTRADDARREAEGLKRIAVTKNEKIDEEYSKRITKLHFLEAEERRKQKLEELQIIERAYRDYFSMKMKMETEIKDLLVKMETAKQNLST